jgi:putative membrane protein
MFQACSGNAKKDSLSDANIKQGLPPITVNEDDAKFAVEAAEIGINDVELSNFAKGKLGNTRVKDLADLILNDYLKINEELMTITTPKNIHFLFSLSGDGQQAKDEWEQKTGNDMDKAYVDKMVRDNEKAIKLYEDAADDVKDATIKAFAIKNLPVLKKHLAAINTVHDSIK